MAFVKATLQLVEPAVLFSSWQGKNTGSKWDRNEPWTLLTLWGPIVHNVVTLCLGPWDKKVHLKQVVICCDCQILPKWSCQSMSITPTVWQKWNSIKGFSSLSVGAHSRWADWGSCSILTFAMDGQYSQYQPFSLHLCLNGKFHCVSLK